MLIRLFSVKNKKGTQTMTIIERTLKERMAADLLTAVSTYHSPEIATSVVDHYGDLRSMSRWSQEEMIDDLISKMNDLD
jgi:hypothetical protein